MTVPDNVGVFAVQPPDESARQAAVARQAQLTKPAGSLGMLEQLDRRVPGHLPAAAVPASEGGRVRR
jgi:nicotinate-nucleotide--dimethylbenzimidazole phosphoribosyltransferase